MAEDLTLPLIQIHEPGESPVPHESERLLAIGIDLGTTNSVVAVDRDGAAEVLRDEDGDGLVPSVVAYAPDGSAIVGPLAQQLLLNRPEAVVGSIKRLMGRGPEDVKSLNGVVPFDIEPAADGEQKMVRINIAGQKLTPVEISADILRALRERAEDQLGQFVTKAVITVPAYFDDAARSATKDAAKLAGIDVLRLVNEPTAAALAYGLDKTAEGLYAVYDFGGGTFDVSLLHMEKGVFQVRATGGDSALGGDDFDHALAEHFLRQREAKVGATTLSSGAVKTALMSARRAKEDLTIAGSVEWPLEIDGQTSIHGLERATFETLIDPLVDRTLAICRAVLADADVVPGDVKGVVLVGGSTRVPLVRRKVAELFAQEPLADINPDEVVAVGAALQASALSGGGADALLLDVTPLSLGLETMGGMIEKVIPRNSPIPTAMAQEFTTYQDGQTAMAIHVVQGEREMVDQNRSLARFVLRGIPPMTAGAARIKVTFAVDADGLLTVTAAEETTGVEQQVEVKPSYGLDDEEMARMLRDSMENAREDMEARLLAESRVEANRVLLAVESALGADCSLLNTTERTAVADLMNLVRNAVAHTDRDAIDGTLADLDRGTQLFAQRRMDKGISEALEGVELEALENKVT